MNHKNGNYFLENFWRILTNIWSILFLIVAVADFFLKGEMSYVLSPFAIVYGAILSIFVGTKEFARWFNMYKSRRHPGEWAAILWSFVVIILEIISWSTKGQYSISTQTISVYIMILTVFAITQSSKEIYTNKMGQ